MASEGAEHEDRINDFMKQFEGLPDDRKDNIFKWFATQQIIIDNTGPEHGGVVPIHRMGDGQSVRLQLRPRLSRSTGGGRGRRHGRKGRPNGRRTRSRGGPRPKRTP